MTSTPFVSTGQLPPAEVVGQLVSAAYARYRHEREGANSDVYPALARAAGDLFGICAVSTSGEVAAAGDADVEFSIMSVSKPFVFALVCQVVGAEEARREARCKRHRPAVQLTCGGGAERGRTHEPDGEPGSDRNDEPRSRCDRR